MEEDWLPILTGRDIAERGPARLPFFFRGTLNGTDYRPFQYAIYAADYRIHGAEPGGWFWTNVLAHAACAALVPLLARRLGADAWTALAAGALFAAHPLATPIFEHLEYRQDAFATLFALVAALLASAAPARKGARAAALGLLALVSGVLAMLTKEIAYALPALVFVAVWRPGDPDRALGRSLALAALFAVPVLLLLYARQAIFGMGAVPRAETLSAATALRQAGEMALSTAAGLAGPALDPWLAVRPPGAAELSLAAERTLSPRGALDAAALAALIAALATALAPAAGRARGLALRALAWTVFGAAPTFAPILQDVTTEMFRVQRLHLAAAGFAVLLASALPRARSNRRWAVSLVLLALGFDFLLTSRANVAAALDRQARAAACAAAGEEAADGAPARLLVAGGLEADCADAFLEALRRRGAVRACAVRAEDAVRPCRARWPRSDLEPPAAERMGPGDYAAGAARLIQIRPEGGGALCVETAPADPASPCAGGTFAIGPRAAGARTPP